MANDICREWKFAWFNHGMKPKVLKALSELIGSLDEDYNLYLDGFRLSFNNEGGGESNWASESLWIDIAMGKASIKRPCFALTLCGGMDFPLVKFGIITSLHKALVPQNVKESISSLALHGKCCIECTTADNDGGIRDVFMMDGRKVVDGEEFTDDEEDNLKPFLDVVNEHLEEALLHLTLDGELQNDS